MMLALQEMCKHKGSLCVSDLVTSDSLRHPVRIVFHKTTLPYIKDGLDVLKKELHSYSGDEQYLFFVHEMELVPLLLRKLYTLQFTKYNFEEWYYKSKKLANTLGIHLLPISRHFQEYQLQPPRYSFLSVMTN